MFDRYHSVQEINIFKTEGEDTCLWKFSNVPKRDPDEEYMGGDVRILCTESFMLNVSPETRTNCGHDVLSQKPPRKPAEPRVVGSSCL